MVQPVDDTYNEVLPPFIDDAHNTITFALTKYYIQDGGVYESLKVELRTAVRERNNMKLEAALERLVPYRVGNSLVNKQIEVRSVKDFRPNPTEE